MARLVLPAIRKRAYLSVCSSLGGVVIVSLMALIFSVMLSYSILLGGIIWFLPHGYAAIKLFHHIETKPKRFMMVFYKSEITKLILVALLFILVMKWIPASFVGLIAGYLCAQVIFCLYYLVNIF